MEHPARPEVKVIEHGFADIPAGGKMLIPTPRLIQDYLHHTSKGRAVDIRQMRRDLASEFNADGTCPLTTGIFLRILAEYTHEQRESGKPLSSLAPVWRAIHPGLPLWKKLSFDTTWMSEVREAEGFAK